MTCLFRFIAILLAFFLLTACGSARKAHYSYIPPTNAMGKMCVSRCFNAKIHCEKLCELREQNCMMTSQNKKNKGRRCPVACQCRPAFNTCYSACDGAVHETSTG